MGKVGTLGEERCSFASNLGGLEDTQRLYWIYLPLNKSCSTNDMNNS